MTIGISHGLSHVEKHAIDTKSVAASLVKRLPTAILDHARVIALSIARTFADRPSYVLGVISAVPNEGKTTISIGLAEVMASDFGLDVILLDAHAERPWEPFDDSSTERPGVSDWVAGKCQLADAVIQLHEKASVVPFGTQPISSRDFLQHLVKVDALQQLREHYSLILLDLPDLMNPTAAALANFCDGLVFVVRAGDTPEEVVRESLPLLQNVTIHGVVLNRHQSAIPSTIRRAFS